MRENGGVAGSGGEVAWQNGEKTTSDSTDAGSDFAGAGSDLAIDGLSSADAGSDSAIDGLSFAVAGSFFLICELNGEVDGSGGEVAGKVREGVGLIENRGEGVFLNENGVFLKESGHCEAAGAIFLTHEGCFVRFAEPNLPRNDHFFDSEFYKSYSKVGYFAFLHRHVGNGDGLIACKFEGKGIHTGL